MRVIINLNPSTVLKTCLRHPSCDSAHRNKEGVFGRMRAALDKVIEIVTECRPNGETDSSSVSLFTGIKELKVRVKSRFCSFSFERASLCILFIFGVMIQMVLLGLERWLLA